MTDHKLDSLYGLCYMQMVRHNITATYVEKKILDEIVNSVKNYILSFVKELKNKVEYDTKRNVESYLTWDADYYKKESAEKEKVISEFENKIANIKSLDFLETNLSLTESVLDTLYPNTLPKSELRETLVNLWKTKSN